MKSVSVMLGCNSEKDGNGNGNRNRKIGGRRTRSPMIVDWMHCPLFALH